jgi:hypothetical protein
MLTSKLRKLYLLIGDRYIKPEVSLLRKKDGDLVILLDLCNDSSSRYTTRLYTHIYDNKLTFEDNKILLDESLEVMVGEINKQLKR